MATIRKMPKVKHNGKIKHDYICGICGKPATYNYQSIYHLWKITADGYFEECDEIEGDFNDFYCDECAEEERII